LRALGKCNNETLVITNTHPLPPFTVSVGQGTYPPVDEMLDLIKAKIKRVIALDGDAMAAEAGNPLSLNMVMLGALIGSGSVPVKAEAMKKTIEELTKRAFLESNLKAFDLGYDSAKMQ
ncbi:MAG: pyruvate ferredoxin oxidoreductase, partial [Deltaproteobacteria bacterium]